MSSRILIFLGSQSMLASLSQMVLVPSKTKTMKAYSLMYPKAPDQSPYMIKWTPSPHSPSDTKFEGHPQLVCRQILGGKKNLSTGKTKFRNISPQEPHSSGSHFSESLKFLFSF